MLLKIPIVSCLGDSSTAEQVTILSTPSIRWLTRIGHLAKGCPQVHQWPMTRLAWLWVVSTRFPSWGLDAESVSMGTWAAGVLGHMRSPVEGSGWVSKDSSVSQISNECRCPLCPWILCELPGFFSYVPSFPLFKAVGEVADLCSPKLTGTLISLGEVHGYVLPACQEVARHFPKSKGLSSALNDL